MQKTRIAKRLPEEYEHEIVKFQQLIIQMRKRNGYEMSQIGNMDETPMNFDMPATHTVNPRGITPPVNPLDRETISGLFLGCLCLNVFSIIVSSKLDHFSMHQQLCTSLICTSESVPIYNRYP